MKTKQFFSHSLLALSLGALVSPSNAAVTFVFEEVGPDLHVSAGGMFNLGTAVPVSTEPHRVLVDPTTSLISLGTPSPTLASIYSVNISGSNNYGSSSGTGVATSSLGTPVGMIFASDSIVVPDGYVSNSPLSASNTFSNLSFSDIGLTPGSTFEWQISIPQVGGGSIQETVTVNVVPEPSTTLLGALGALGLIARRRRQ